MLDVVRSDFAVDTSGEAVAQALAALTPSDLVPLLAFLGASCAAWSMAGCTTPALDRRRARG
jgi:hypothetical protein